MNTIKPQLLFLFIFVLSLGLSFQEKGVCQSYAGFYLGLSIPAGEFASDEFSYFYGNAALGITTAVEGAYHPYSLLGLGIQYSFTSHPLSFKEGSDLRSKGNYNFHGFKSLILFNILTNSKVVLHLRLLPGFNIINYPEIYRLRNSTEYIKCESTTRYKMSLQGGIKLRFPMSSKIAITCTTEYSYIDSGYGVENWDGQIFNIEQFFVLLGLDLSIIGITTKNDLNE